VDRDKLLLLAKEWTVPLVVGVFLLSTYLPDPAAVDTGRPYSEWVKVWLSVGGIGLVLVWKLLPGGFGQRLLIALTLIAGINYARYTPDVVGKSVDAYDLIHYYLGAKYFDDLGYYDLYPAALLADAEAGAYNQRSTYYRAQDAERGYRERVPVREGIERGKQVRERMGPAKWKQFEHDFLVLQRHHRLGRGLWHELINDRGFNGTPAWLVVGRPIAKLFPVELIKALCYLDFFLLALALFALAWAYGWVTACFALFFLFITYSLRWPYVTWAFLRYDWVSALMIGMALLKRNPWKTDKPLVPYAIAGVLTGYAGLVRLFPVVWMFGPFMKGVASLLKPSAEPLGKRADRRMLVMGAAFLAMLVVQEGTAAGCYGTDAIKTHAGNIAEHIKPEELSSRRIGFALALTYDGRAEPKWLPHKRKIAIKEGSTERNVVALIILGILGWALRRRRPDEAFAVGFIPFFLLTTASYYYLVCRITLIAWHASDLSKLRNRVGLAWLLGLEFVANYAETYAPGYRVMLIGHLAWGITLYVVGLTIALSWEAGRGADVEEEGPTSAPSSRASPTGAVFCPRP
jgi:hypothetical protein